MCMGNLRPTIRLARPIRTFKMVTSTCVGPYSDTEIRRGVWMKAESEPKLKEPILYTPGFHTCRYRADAERMSAQENRCRDYEAQRTIVEKVLIAGLATGGWTPNHYRSFESCAAQYIYFFPKGETTCSTLPPSS